MDKLNRDREPRLSRRAARAEGYDERARRGRSWLKSVLIVLALSACGVAGYFIADAVYLASQRPVPSPAQPAPAPAEVVAAPAETPQQAEPAAPVAAPTARTVGSWTLVCPGANVPRADCALVQRLVDADKRPLVVWSVTRDTDGTVRTMWQTPTNVDRQRGLVLDVGDGRPRTVPFAACAEQYCVVRGILAPAYLATLAAAPRVTVAVSDTVGNAATHAFALAGLADGLAWLGGR
jgi:invasion protein IalB